MFVVCDVFDECYVCDVCNVCDVCDVCVIVCCEYGLLYVVCDVWCVVRRADIPYTNCLNV